VGRKCRPSRPPIPEEREVNRLHAEAVKKRKEVAEAVADRKRRRKEKHDKACKIARAEGKPRPATPRMPRPTSRVGTRRQRVRTPRRYIRRLVTRTRQRRCGRRTRPSQGRSGGAHASGGAKVAHTGGGRQIIHAHDRAEVSPASDGRAGPHARDVDWRRWVRSERGDARADGLKAPGWSGDDTLGSVVEGRQRAAGPKEWHGQT